MAKHLSPTKSGHAWHSLNRVRPHRGACSAVLEKEVQQAPPQTANRIKNEASKLARHVAPLLRAELPRAEPCLLFSMHIMHVGLIHQFIEVKYAPHHAMSLYLVSIASEIRWGLSRCPLLASPAIVADWSSRTLADFCQRIQNWRPPRPRSISLSP